MCMCVYVVHVYVHIWRPEASIWRPLPSFAGRQFTSIEIQSLIGLKLINESKLTGPQAKTISVSLPALGVYTYHTRNKIPNPVFWHARAELSHKFSWEPYNPSFLAFFPPLIVYLKFSALVVSLPFNGWAFSPDPFLKRGEDVGSKEGVLG